MLASSSKTGQPSDQILDRFFAHRTHDKRLALTPAYFDMLAQLGNPHKKLPPVFHVAGTNGKGSTCAFLRAMLEATGYKVHVYTSPHLVSFHERIRIAGELISENELVDLLTACERIDSRAEISDFEATTAAAFAAFAQHPADFAILETGLGGRLDATNVIEKPLATIITRISYDHRDYLGDTLKKIAGEKAGIMRKGVPCFVTAQPDEESMKALSIAARKTKAPLHVADKGWQLEIHPHGFRYRDMGRDFDLPLPGLTGAHQFENAGLAIAALSTLLKSPPQDAIARGLRSVEWPARLQKLEQGRLPRSLLPGWELWLDGGHNDSAGEALATQMKNWRLQNPSRGIHLVCGMLKTKQPREFLMPMLPYLDSACALSIPGETISFTADDLATRMRETEIENVSQSSGLEDALAGIAGKFPPGLILICGSLYLAGYVLKRNGE